MRKRLPAIGVGPECKRVEQGEENTNKMNMQETTLSALATIFPAQAISHLAASAETAEEIAYVAPREPGVLVTNPAKHGTHMDVLCNPDQVLAVAQCLDQTGFFLESIAGVDWPEKQQLEILYDYNRLGGEHCRVLVRTQVPRQTPVLPSISAVFPAADWHERETFDFYGIQFQGHPNLTRILLPEDADFHPLLKDYIP